MGALHPSNPPAETPFRGFDLVALGASAGGLDPVRQVLRRLAPAFPVPIVIVQHLSATFASQLPDVLTQQTAMPCRWADDGDRLAAGRVFVARAGANLVLDDSRTLRSVPTAKPRMGWPSIDAFFLSVAEVLGPSAIGVVLSGMMQDGAAGIAAIRRAGGATMVQHPSLAEFPDMPKAAINLGRADLAMSPSQIADELVALAGRGVR